MKTKSLINKINDKFFTGQLSPSGETGEKTAVKPNKQKTDWEKEFNTDCWDTKDGVVTVTYLMRGGNKVGKLTERVTKEMIKSYVKIRLQQQKTEIIKEIEGIVGKNEVIDKNTVKQAMEVEKLNEGNISAREILEDIGNSFNTRNEIRKEIRERLKQITNLKEK